MLDIARIRWYNMYQMIHFRGEVMEIVSTLAKSFLFSGMNEDQIAGIIEFSLPTVAEFRRGELVYSSESEEATVGFISSGKCEIRLDRPDGSRAVLNTLEECDSFGVLSVYSADEFPTRIYATRNSRIIFFKAEQIKRFVNNNSQISTNLITFLANRISFLNKKIATFSGVRVEDRLAAFLLCERQRLGADEFTFNCQKTAEEINAGRASVYRALSSLEECGFITFVDKKINITDPNGLERMKK